MKNRFICIHGHFYQPPRENPWLEAVELQDSAYPYHDWNERITAECYAPNTAARILDSEGRIARIANNYSRMSFNFGPTLLSWMEHESPETYSAILEADRRSQLDFSGHGSAIAQAYNHMILPLANSRDKYVQVLWGIRDFEHRFGRRPEGMWLPETAVDLEALDIMAGLGIQFTILAPNQASRVRQIGSRTWRDISGGRIDPTRAYLLNLPSGRQISLFFYDGPISRGIAFEEFLASGEQLAGRLTSAFSESTNWPQLVNIATDGETYGHHRPHGDMALAYAIDYIESNGLARITNYGEFLERFPPRCEVEIRENSSWSCAHGVERWRSDCGCSSGMHGDWRQAWRGPLRQALDWLRDSVTPRWEERASDLVLNPVTALEDYISVVLDRSPANIEEFISSHSAPDLPDQDRTALLKLMELRRQSMLMYTSCGWFFDELSGIETVQVIQYAGRVVQLFADLFSDSVEQHFLELLGQAKSNIPEHGDGAQIYRKFVKPAMVDLQKVGAHYAVSSVFEQYPDKTSVYCYSVERQDYRTIEAGRARLVSGRARVTSQISLQSEDLSFSVLHFGDHNLSAGVRRFQDEEAYLAMLRDSAEPFSRADFAEVIRVIDRDFGASTYSLKSLFRDEQRQVLGRILDSTVGDAEALYRQLYEHHAPLMRFLADLGAPVPRALQTATEVVLNADLRRAIEARETDVGHIGSLMQQARESHVALDSAALGYSLGRVVERLASNLRAQPMELSILQDLEDMVEITRSLPFEVDLWRAQDIYYETLLATYPAIHRKARRGDRELHAWLDAFTSLGEKLGVKTSIVETLPGIDSVMQEILNPTRVPGATYRIQFNQGFRFPDAQALVPYLNDLGVTDCYASPLIRARAGSSHGYDVVDHGRLNPDYGNDEDFRAFSGALRDRDMGLLMDIVSNHMSIAESSNAWWMDVLENGPSSVYASYFDINWEMARPEMANRVLLPMLEDQYGRVLESGKLQLAYEDGAFFVRYYETSLPLEPCSYREVLQHRLAALTGILGPENEHLVELESILTALSHLPAFTDLAPDRVAERSREKEVIKRRIAALYDVSSEVRNAIDLTVRALNGTPDDPRSYDMLGALLDAQAYRLAYWRVATDEINYRRFFDVNEMAGIRVELPEVFQASHQMILRLLAEGLVTGLRIDHSDGLWDPESYFRKVQQCYVVKRAEARLGEDWREDIGSAAEELFNNPADLQASSAVSHGQAEPGVSPHAAREEVGEQDGPEPAWTPPRPLYMVAEKILLGRETPPEGWMVHGTTGYDFLNTVNGLFVDGSNRKAFDSIYRAFVGPGPGFRDIANTTRKIIMVGSLASEINSLGSRLDRIADRNRWYRDFTLASLTFALREVIACLPVYRTYITGRDCLPSQRDQGYIRAAVAEARRRNARTAEPVFDFIQDTLLLQNFKDFREEDWDRLTDFVMRFQQITGPVMAKGVEDTAFYVYNRLVSLNEVGGSPEEFGISVRAFHRRNTERRQRWPHSLLASSTHDTKRSEDVRARINVLSEMPKEWRSALNRWSRLNARKKTMVDGSPAPDRNDEYLLYQALIGAWPDEPQSADDLSRFRERIVAYMLKATKEAKVHTSWVNPYNEYDAAVEGFVRRLLVEGDRDPFINSFRDFQGRVACYGQYNGLGQVLLKLVSPGVPDIYQGSEVWDYSLVDPDNRRPVDFQRRIALLADLKAQIEQAGQDLTGLVAGLLGAWRDGRIKLYVTSRSLEFRRAHRRLFGDGEYVPLESAGDRADHVCAFARVLDEESALAVVPRLVFRLTGGSGQPPLGPEVWKETRLVLPSDHAGRHYRNVFTGEVLAAGEQDGGGALLMASVLAHFPVALLERMEE